ncbi:hypothetical protein AB6Q56_07030 [Dechloromonas sp. ARDL1]|uniref:hypothetical protein n=1 Tax=Dechloromonas sp. ARDL1 TaxID=3322121 RepID=UPI003DA6D247
MAETTQLAFSHKEVATALLKAQGIHEGIWMLSVSFGMAATNISQTPGGSDLNPAAIVPVLGIGLQRTDALNALSVDAAVENPA